MSDIRTRPDAPLDLRADPLLLPRQRTSIEPCADSESPPALRLLVALLGTAVGGFAVHDGVRPDVVPAALVVVLAVPALLWLVLRRVSYRGDLRHADLPVAAVLVAGATALVLGHRTGNGDDLRVDLLAVPLLLSGLLVLVLGVRVLRVAAGPLLYGLLLWPYPVTVLGPPVARLLDGLTHTVSTLLVAASRQGGAVPGDVSLMRVGGVGVPAFEVDITAAYADVSGVVVFLLLGLAVQPLVQGRLRGRLAWLAAVLAAVWIATVLRVVLVAFVGNLAGHEPAAGVLHPVVGLVFDAGVVVVMASALPGFGLTPRRVSRTGEPAPSRPVTSSRRAVGVRYVLVAAAAATFIAPDPYPRPAPSPAAASAAPQTAGPEQAAGPQRVTNLTDVTILGDGARSVARPEWARHPFGDDPAGDHYRFHGSARGHDTTVWVVSLVAGSDDALNARSVIGAGGVASGRMSVALGTSVIAERYRLHRPEGDTWSLINWQWAVADGRDERITLLAARPVTDGDAVDQLLRASADRLVSRRLPA